MTSADFAFVILVVCVTIYYCFKRFLEYKQGKPFPEDD